MSSGQKRRWRNHRNTNNTTLTGADYGISPKQPHTSREATNDPSNVFPRVPYKDMESLTASEQLQKLAHHDLSKITPLTVPSAQFAHFSNIYRSPTLLSIDVKLTGNCENDSYETINAYSGKRVLLRRIKGVSVSHSTCNQVFADLRQFRHPCLLPLYGITRTNEFVLGSEDILLEYRFPTGAVPLLSVWHEQETRRHVPEGALWSLASQLLSLLLLFHNTKQPLRGLCASSCIYIPLTERVIFGALGVADLFASPNTPHEDAINNNVVSLGKLLSALAYGYDTPRKPNGDTVGSVSNALETFIQVCLKGERSAPQLSMDIGERIAVSLGNQFGQQDFLLSEACKEIHNGRLLKLLIKLSFLTTSPVLAQEDDQFMIRMYHYYLFHQVDDQGNARWDWAHVFFSLNKLDSGLDELVQLVSPDSDGLLLIVSYRYLHEIVEKLSKRLTPPKDI